MIRAHEPFYPITAEMNDATDNGYDVRTGATMREEAILRLMCSSVAADKLSSSGEVSCNAAGHAARAAILADAYLEVIR